MRRAAAEGRLTSSVAHAGRRRIRVAAMLMDFFDDRSVTAATASQSILDEYIATRGRVLTREHGFIAWLRRTRINARHPHPQSARPGRTRDHRRRTTAGPSSTGSYTTAATGATRASANCSRCCSPASMADCRDEDEPDQTDRRHSARHVSQHRNPAAGAPGHLGARAPGRPRHEPARITRHRLTLPRRQPRTPPEHRRTSVQLVANGMKPYEGRKATLLQLAADIPAPVPG
jgi:hypothetical protein